MTRPQLDAHEINERREQVVSLLGNSKTDMHGFFRGWCNDIFYRPFANIHSEMIKFMESEGKKKLLVAPRGIGKTSFGKGLAIKETLFGESLFIVYISFSEGHATMQTENIKASLISNPLLRKAFGSPKEYIKPMNAEEFTGLEATEETSAEELGKEFSKRATVLFGRTLIVPRGCGQQVRGLNWRNKRPDLIIFDDPENRKLIKNENNRVENLTWFMDDVSKCIDTFAGNYKMLYLDTLKHPDALPAHIENMASWETKKLPLCTKEYKSLVPELMSDDEVMEIVNEHREAGNLDGFHREYMHEATSPETASFREEYFNRYSEGDLTREDLQGFINFVVYDPARSVTPQSDKTAIIGISIDTGKARTYVRDVVNGRLHTDEQFAAAISVARGINAQVIGVEVTGLKEFITKPFKDYLVETGNDDISIVELHPRGNTSKLDRIAALMPDYRRGNIWHNQNCCGELEGQLLSFPNSRFDDLMDALSYKIQMLDTGGIFNVAEVVDDEDEEGLDFEEIEDELRNLNYESALDQEDCLIV